MSLFVITSSLLAIKPRVRFSRGVLHSRSNLTVLLLNLGTYFKTVMIDADLRTITIRKRFFYFFTHGQDYTFDEVRRITYTYESLTTSFSFILREANDEIDKFYVDLELQSRDEIRLWGFYGEGAIYSGWKGVLLGGDEPVDFMGDQENAAHSYATLLCQLMDKKLV